MRSPTKAVEIVENAGDGDPGLKKNGAILNIHLEFFEPVPVLRDLAINIRLETVFEGSFPS